MNSRPKVCVLTGFGINCDYETEYVFRKAGGDPVRVHLNDLVDGSYDLLDFAILIVPGGFSFGDHIASGRVLANRIRFRLGKILSEFVREGRLVLGICNGFQVLVKMGLIPFGLSSDGTARQTATITYNSSGKFEDRWVWLEPDSKSPCIYTKDLPRIYLPIRHGEGRFVPAGGDVLSRIEKEHLAPLRYVSADGGPAEYPENPNGSVAGIAGLCDPTGRVFGLMPHPEAFHIKTHHPRWTRESLPEEGLGMKIFENAITYALDRKLG